MFELQILLGYWILNPICRGWDRTGGWNGDFIGRIDGIPTDEWGIITKEDRGGRMERCGGDEEWLWMKAWGGNDFFCHWSTYYCMRTSLLIVVKGFILYKNRYIRIKHTKYKKVYKNLNFMCDNKVSESIYILIKIQRFVFLYMFFKE